VVTFALRPNLAKVGWNFILQTLANKISVCRGLLIEQAGEVSDSQLRTPGEGVSRVAGLHEYAKSLSDKPFGTINGLNLDLRA